MKILLTSPLVAMTTFLHHIGSVVRRSAKEKMDWVNTGSIVTSVTNKHSFRNLFTVGKLPSVTMCLHPLLIKMKLAITMVRLSIFFPKPAIILTEFSEGLSPSLLNTGGFILKEWVAVSVPFPVVRSAISLPTTERSTAYNLADLFYLSVSYTWVAISRPTKIMLVAITITFNKFKTVIKTTGIFHYLDFTSYKVHSQGGLT